MSSRDPCRHIYITHECYFEASHVACSCHEGISEKLVPDATRAYCGAWGDGLDRTSSEEEGMCDTNLRLKFCSALPTGWALLVGSGVEGEVGGREATNSFRGCSGTLGVAAGGGIVGGGDEPGAGSQPPGKPGRRVGDLERVAIESGGFALKGCGATGWGTRVVAESVASDPM